jgi:hypothetical protein
LAAVHVDRLTIQVLGEIRQKEHSDLSYPFRLGQSPFAKVNRLTEAI